LLGERNRYSQARFIACKALILPAVIPLFYHYAYSPLYAVPKALLVNMQEPCGLFVADPLVIKYINRLSDYLFVLSRYAGYLAGVADWH